MGAVESQVFLAWSSQFVCVCGSQATVGTVQTGPSIIGVGESSTGELGREDNKVLIQGYTFRGEAEFCSRCNVVFPCWPTQTF